MPPAARRLRWSHRLVRSLAHALSTEQELARIHRIRYADAGHGYDAFGLHPDWLALGNALLHPLYQHYFRVRSYGSSHLPREGGAIVIANHSGTLPLDALMLCVDVYRHTEPPRVLRPIGDRFIPRLPFAGVLSGRLGAVSGSLANVRALLERGELCLIFPEGLAAIGKTRDQRYRLQGWRVGHAELALRHRVPIVPVAVIGPEEQWPVIAHLDALHPYGLPYVPVPATPLPLPVRYHVHYGEPIDLAAVVGTDEPTTAAVQAAARHTHDALQRLIAQGVARREGVFR